jgi:hypothetical protein
MLNTLTNYGEEKHKESKCQGLVSIVNTPVERETPSSVSENTEFAFS